MPDATIGSSQFFYRMSSDAIPADRTVLILLHGSGGDSSVWEEQLLAFAPFITVIAPDLPGHGESAGPHLQQAKDYAVWLDTFIGALEGGRFFLIGHSLGGAIAQEYSRIGTNRLQGVVLTGCGTRFIVSQEYMATVKNNFSAAVNLSCQMAYAAKNVHAFHARGFEMLTKNGRETLYNDLLACTAFYSSQWISSIDIPALILCGQEDTITPPADAKDLATLLPQAECKIIPGSGHMVMMEAASEFNKIIKKFIMRTIEIADGLPENRKSGKLRQIE